MKKPETKFIIVFLSASGLFLAGIIALSVWIDPRGLFGTNKFIPLVSTDRLTKLALLKNFKPNPDILILGASNVFKINPEKIKNLTGFQTFNAGVSNAGAEDFLAISEYALQDLRLKPRFIILGIHPESFNSNRINPQTINMRELRSKLNITPKQYIANLFSTLNENLTLQYLGDVAKTLYYISTGYPAAQSRFQPDGYKLSASNAQGLKNALKRDQEVIIDHFKTDYRRNALSDERKQYFEKFLNLAKKNNISVSIVLLPFHPEVLARLKESPEFQSIYNQLDGYLQVNKKQYSFSYYDFMDIRAFGGDENDFSDLVHVGDKNSDIITNIVLRDYLETVVKK